MALLLSTKLHHYLRKNPMPFVPMDPGELRPPAARKTRSKWFRFQFPIMFAFVYEFLTWECWVPLMRPQMEKNTTPKASLWELHVLLFGIELRVLLVLVLFALCLPFVPPVRRWEALFVGALTGALTSVFDYRYWNFGLIQTGGPLQVLALAAPVFAFGVAFLLARWIDSLSTPQGAPAE